MSREVGVTYSAPMAGAIWRDEKWKTRRFSGIAHVPEDAEFTCEAGGGFEFVRRDGAGLTVCGFRAVPRLRVGDVMVVREPWRVDHDLDDTAPRYLAQYEAEWRAANMPIHWEADGPAGLWCGKFRQAMHMPFAFARSRRVVTAVRVERLGDISEADANAEGFYRHDGNGRRTDSPLFPSAAREFSVYWTRLHGPGAWERDRRKWVWVYEFARRSA